MTPAHKRYRLRHSLGRGSYGEVWLAVMETGAVRADVAVKLLREGLDPGDQALERLRDEGRLLGLLNHPVILKVHDLLILDGRVALVTEYVDGADLEACFLAEGGMPVRALVEVIGQVADALGVAWDAPSPDGGTLALVHRDVKPANIRIGRHGDVKLLDFGIARAADLHREARTETESIVGTVPYMAPERFDTAAPIGPAGDVFALGAVLYEGLKRERLFESLSTRDAYLLAMSPMDHGGFVADRIEALTHVPPGLKALLAETLAWDPTARPTAAAVARRCEHLTETLAGSSLRRFCRERAWPEAPPMPGPLDGRVLSAVSAPEPVASVTPAVRPSRAVAGRAWLIGAAALGLVGVVGGLAIVAAGIAVVGSVRPEREAQVLAPIVEPEPPPVPVPAQVPDPLPAPPVRPTAPRPAPPPTSFTVEGGVPVELRAGGRRWSAGAVPPGTYEIWADFGDGLEAAGEARVAPGETRTVRCSRLRHNCGDP